MINIYKKPFTLVTYHYFFKFVRKWKILIINIVNFSTDGFSFVIVIIFCFFSISYCKYNLNYKTFTCL